MKKWGGKEGSILMVAHVSILGKYAVTNKLRIKGRKMVRESSNLKVDFCSYIIV